MRKTTLAQTNSAGWPRSIKMLIAVSVLTILGFCAVCVSVMLDMRHSEEELARQSLENLTSTIAADVTRNIEIYDLSLRAVASNLGSPELDGVSRELRQLVLFDNASTAKHFGNIQVFSASGNLTIDAASLDPEKLNVADQHYFRVHRESVDSPLFISRPMIHRGTLSIVLSRRINDQFGNFSGVVAGTIRASYFRELFDRLKLGDKDAITILRSDGVVLMRAPFEASYIGRDVSSSPTVERALREPSGSIWGDSALDGLRRLFVWRGGKTLVVFVGKPATAVYAMWNRQAVWTGSVMAFLIVIASLGTTFLVREMARRARAEARLEDLATTDSLTGLSNRRKLDLEIDLEWRRALRAHDPITLLMIDADNFKSYNDRFGHQAGDRVLISLGACIGAFAAKPGDCAARYGGEEFALLLPGVHLSEALRIAERLRERAAVCHDDPAPVTVSIGVVTLSADASACAGDLIEMADKALYEAKRNGRNCCRVAGVSFEAIAA